MSKDSDKTTKKKSNWKTNRKVTMDITNLLISNPETTKSEERKDNKKVKHTIKFNKESNKNEQK